MQIPLKILIVGGEPELIDVLMNSLARAGYAVDAAPEGSAALAQLSAGKCDLALLVVPADATPLCPAASQYRFGPVVVDLAKGRVMRNGELVGIPAKEMELLRYLIAHRGATVSRDELLREVWNYQSQLTRTVDVHIAGLRQKVEENPEQPNYILTVRGRGYLFRG